MDLRRRSGLVAAILLLATAEVSALDPLDLPARSESRSHYVIQARLDGETKVLTGSERITYTLESGSEAVTDLWFHLYLNAFSNNRSTHLVESKGQLRGVEMNDGWGWSHVTGVRVAFAGDPAPTNVTTSFAYQRPDDGREEDRTVFKVDLPRPLAGGETITIEVDWTSQLPRVRRRTGYKGDFLLVAQWFPKLGVYEPGRGWNAHQFHRDTEFYSDYGTYEVTLDLPAEYNGKVGGSGVLEKDQLERDGRCVVRFVAPSEKDRVNADRTGKRPLVHDFTWTGDPRYVVERFTFRFSEWAESFPTEVELARTAFGPNVDVTLRDVDVTVLIHPERREQAFRHYHATCAALFFYGLWFGEYPYQHVTVIDPAWGARAAGGMEYPTLFTSGTRKFTEPENYVPESVTVHEAGHQFWYGLVGNNEFEAAWLDEGFNSYTDSEVLYRVYGERESVTWYAGLPVEGVAVGRLPGGGPVVDALAAKRMPLPMLPDLVPLRASGFLDRWRDQPALTFVPEHQDPRWGDRSGYLRSPDIDPIETHAWEHVDRGSYRANSYPGTAVVLRSLKAVVGDAAFLRGMRHYAETWRYRHPYPDDFYAAFQTGAGVDVEWYFSELFQGTGTIDWSVDVEQERRPEPDGFFQGEGGAFLERPDEETGGDDDEEKAPFAITIALKKRGELALPVDVRLSFEDGRVETIQWSRAEQQAESWKRIELERDGKLLSVEIDPDRRWFLDTDMSNNQWFDEHSLATPWRWAERVLVQYGHYLHWVGGVGG